MAKKIYSRFVLLLILMSMHLTVYSQNSIEPDWQSVLGGNVVAPPKRTSYGFISLTEGRLMSASTGNGTVIWSKSIKGVPSTFFNINDENFVYITTDNSTKLSLYNPDGVFLWEVQLAEPAIADPVFGRDGRVFIVGKTSVTCYGTHGTKKWFTRLPQGRDIPLTEMNDGSLLYITSFTKDGASVGIRISPYGELLEEIEFTDQITTLTSFSDGIILGFENGTIGSCAVINNVTETTWSISSTKADNASPLVILPGYSGFCVLYSNLRIAEYSLQDRKLLWQVTNPNIKAGKNFFAAFDHNRYVFASQDYTVAYNTVQSGVGGNVLWEKQCNPSGETSFPIITSSAYLILSSSDWVISGYSLHDTANLTDAEKLINGTQVDVKKTDSYSGFQSLNRKPNVSNTSFATIAQNLTAGDYGTLEPEYKRIIQKHLTQYETEYMDATYSFSNVVGKANILEILPKFETSDYDYFIPLMLTNETESSLIAATLRAAGKIAYDRDEIMLKSIEHLYNTKKTALQPNVLSELCETVYSICRYMGRPALTKRGKAILLNMLLPGTNSTVKAKAQEVLVRFIELET